MFPTALVGGIVVTLTKGSLRRRRIHTRTHMLLLSVKLDNHRITQSTSRWRARLCSPDMLNAAGRVRYSTTSGSAELPSMIHGENLKYLLLHAE